MKKIILALALLFSIFTIQAQQKEVFYYKAVVAELYSKDINGDWELLRKNIDLDIPIIVEDEFINIQADRPTMYKLYRGENSKQSINTQLIVGTRYRAFDLKDNVMCFVDVVKIRNVDDFYMISIVFDSYNLRYYIKL